MQLLKDISARQRSDIPRSELKLGEQIGRGASGAVYKATFRGTEVTYSNSLVNFFNDNALGGC